MGRHVVACRYLSLPDQTRARHVKDKSNAAYILGWSERRVSGGSPFHLPAAFELLSSEPDFQEGLQPLHLQMTATALPGWFVVLLLHMHLFRCDSTLFDPYVRVPFSPACALTVMIVWRAAVLTLQLDN